MPSGILRVRFVKRTGNKKASTDVDAFLFGEADDWMSEPRF